MIPDPTEGSLDRWIERAKVEVITACLEGKLEAFGHTADNEEPRPVPPIAWLGVKMDEADSSIGKARPMWFGIHFPSAAVRSLWPASPLAAVGPPKKPTGPTAKYRREAEGIARQWEIAAAKAIADGAEPPPYPTAKQVWDKLEQSRGHPVSPRTVRRTWAALRGKDGSGRSPAV